VTVKQFYLTDTFRRKNWRLLPRLRLGDRKLIWGLSEEVLW
jgi:hypothetical protein